MKKTLASALLIVIAVSATPALANAKDALVYAACRNQSPPPSYISGTDTARVRDLSIIRAVCLKSVAYFQARARQESGQQRISMKYFAADSAVNYGAALCLYGDRGAGAIQMRTAIPYLNDVVANSTSHAQVDVASDDLAVIGSLSGQ